MCPQSDDRITERSGAFYLGLTVLALVLFAGQAWGAF